MAAKPNLDVLHIASFTGNIGDNANHLGSRSEFAKNLPFDLTFTEMEMREFFWGQRQWDDNLIETINSYDLCIFGGGNYFELWVEHSRTGCSIDLPPEMLENITTPLLFYGLGVDAGQGVPDICRERFTKFLSYLLDSPRCCVTVRNDGARSNLEAYFTSLPLERIIDVPDGGFFFQTEIANHVELQQNAKNIVVNLAGDMLEQRYPGGGSLLPVEFSEEFAQFIERMLVEDPTARIIFVPHIFRDLDSIHQVLDRMTDPSRRQRVVVAPYMTGEAACHKLFGLYAGADLVLAMRFHASVVAMALGTPVIGLHCYPQIQLLYRSLGLEEYLVSVQKPSFSSKLLDTINIRLTESINNNVSSSMKRVADSIREGHAAISAWLKECT
ncbi:hypothetical protein NBRC116494_26140 [Aurantivibrio plasticivorans]